MIWELRTAPWTAFAALCASMLWCGMAFLLLASQTGSPWVAVCVAPAIIGVLLLPWSTVRREGIALIAGPFVIAAAFLLVMVGVGVGALIGAVINR